MKTVKVTIRMSERMRDAIAAHGEIGLVARAIFADALGVGPVELPRGLAAVKSRKRLREISAEGVAAKADAKKTRRRKSSGGKDVPPTSE